VSHESLWAYTIKVCCGMTALMVSYFVVICFLAFVGWAGRKMGFFKDTRRPLYLGRARRYLR
jgi:hypothetical protein